MNSHLKQFITGLGKYFYGKCTIQEKARNAPFNAQTGIPPYQAILSGNNLIRQFPVLIYKVLLFNQYGESRAQQYFASYYS